MILTIVLVFLALVHFYWLFGKVGLNQALPTNEQGERLLNPGKFLTLAVGIILLSFAWVSHMLDLPHELWIELMGWGLAILFFLRAVGDFKMVGLFKKIKHTGFAKYDTWLYVPLCFLISVGFVMKILG